MSYPVQNSPLVNHIQVLINNTLVHDWVTQVNGRIGAVPDVYFCSLKPGSCSIELYDINSTIDALLVPGNPVQIRTIPSPGIYDYTNIYRGKIRDVSTTYEFDTIHNRLAPRTRVEAVDLVADLANKQIDANTFSKTPNVEKISVADFGSAFTTATGQTIAGASTLTTTYINQFNRQINAVEAMDLVARSVNKYTYQNMSPSVSYGNFGYASVTSPTPAITISDGTHTGSPSPLLKMVDVDYGYSSQSALSELNFSNVGLNRAPKAAKDSGISDIDVTYKATQSIGYDNKADINTVVATDNLGHNLLQNTGSESTSPQNVWPTSYFNYGVSPTMTLNDHPTVVATCNTATSSFSIYLNQVDTQNNFVTSPPGGMTGNWLLGFKVRGTTPTTVPMYARLVWYNASGTVLRTDNGTSTSFTNTAWTAISLQVTTPPTGAVTAQAVAVVNGAASVGYQFYITEAVFSRIGATSSFFNGDTTDDASYLYTWTGQPGASASQKNTNNLTALGASILARNTVTKKVKTVTLNAFQNTGAISAVPLLTQTAGLGATIWVNGTSGTYVVCGYSFDMTPDTFSYTLDVAKI
jgi:hypothetical protein